MVGAPYLAEWGRPVERARDFSYQVSNLGSAFKPIRRGGLAKDCLCTIPADRATNAEKVSRPGTRIE
jgi:hypothetical protein